MFYALMKLAYAMYFAGAVYYLAKNVSEAAFSPKVTGKRAFKVLKAIGFGLVWPLALLSANGRKRLSFWNKGA